MNGPYDRFRLLWQEVETRGGRVRVLSLRGATPADVASKGFVAAADLRRLQQERDAAIMACRLARYAFTTAIPFGTNPTARDQSRRALDEAMAAVSTVLANHDAT